VSDREGPAAAERQVALRVLRRVREGAYADRALDGEVRRAGLDARGRGQARRMAFGAVQRRRTLDWLVDAHLEAPERVEADVRDILRLGAYEICWSDAVRPATAVDQAVRLARALPGAERRARGRAGLVNAVLRRVADGGRAVPGDLPDDTAAGAALRHSMPDWIARRLIAALGHADAIGVMEASNAPSESSFRWNRLRGPRRTLDRLLPAAHRWDALVPDAVVVDGPFALEDSPVWARGLAVAQSRASMLPVLALAPRPGERVLDMCAAPGVKATQIAACTLNRAQVTAVEIQPGRARALRSLADRLGARLDVVHGDARAAELGAGFDAVLLDPPCTGLGVLSARPDARWRRREEDLADLVALQRSLLARARSLVRPGGRIVYSTCTLLPEENEQVVATAGLPVADLAAAFPGLAHPGLPGALRTLPGRDGTDGFVVVRLEVPNG
jgi:16S rRNA (cytosine967-C5)-methyltransferase